MPVTEGLPKEWKPELALGASYVEVVEQHPNEREVGLRTVTSRSKCTLTDLLG